MDKFIRRVILKSFLKIPLTGQERQIVEYSLINKYAPTLRNALLVSILTIPAILVFDKIILATVLIPATTVAGTAWYAISLSNLKKKFQDFGSELTAEVFFAFSLSLVALFYLVVAAFNQALLAFPAAWLANEPWVTLAGIAGSAAVFMLLYRIFSGSLKYDVNDSMLAGQSEVAENFFKRSLSLLHKAAYHLRESRGLLVSNYHLAVAFEDIFARIVALRGVDAALEQDMREAKELRINPDTLQDKVDEMVYRFIEHFLGYARGASGGESRRLIRQLREETSLVKSHKEVRDLTDTRFAYFIEKIADVIEIEGEGLFTSRQEIEKKFLLASLPSKYSNAHSLPVLQGYLGVDKEKEIRIRRVGEQHYKTIKEYLSDGTRWEEESLIPKEEFERLWPQITGNPIEKRRYYISEGDTKVEVDVFDGAHKGLMVAEVEFADSEKAKEFKPFPWFGEEVTEDKKYKNASLAGL